jgi:hypothetical protein
LIDINEKRFKSELICRENFDKGLEQWQLKQMPGGKVEIVNYKLEITDGAGCNIWFTRKLEEAIEIEYIVRLIKNDGLQDRMSDLNCFWMETDPGNPTNLFKNTKARRGKFSNYNSLQLYYMGVGGNDNTTTRFRKYVGNGERPLLPEQDLTGPPFMLTPNKVYQIKIVANKGRIQYYYRDNILFVDFENTSQQVTLDLEM